ncbi:anti-sigma factor [Nannocystaceae bacterium ST9]
MSDTQKRLHTLLTDRASEGLDEQFEAELAHLLAGGEIDPSYEQAAAGIELALLPHDEPLPPALAATLLAQADDYWRVSPAPAPAEPGRPVSGTTQTGYMPADLRAEAEAVGGPANWTGPQPKIAAAIEDQRGTEDDFEDESGDGESNDDESQAELERPRERKRKSGKKPLRAEESQAASRTGVVELRRPSQTANIAAYASAIAAVIVLGIAIYLFTQRDRGAEDDLEAIQAQLEGAGDKLEWSFAAQADPAVGESAGGSVVWSSDLQAGVMTLRGLAINEPTDAQYQLWIIDETREGAPVDGGVFDVTGEGDVTIPIDAKLLVGRPKAFAITVERPGGVVVSAQERVVMLAASP